MTRPGPARPDCDPRPARTAIPAQTDRDPRPRPPDVGVVPDPPGYTGRISSGTDGEEMVLAWIPRVWVGVEGYVDIQIEWSEAQPKRGHAFMKGTVCGICSLQLKHEYYALGITGISVFTTQDAVVVVNNNTSPSLPPSVQ